jgi:hypothetical protein
MLTLPHLWGEDIVIATKSTLMICVVEIGSSDREKHN